MKNSMPLEQIVDEFPEIKSKSNRLKIFLLLLLLDPN